MERSQRRPLARERERERERDSSVALSDDTSCASAQSSVQRRVAELRSQRGNFRGFFETSRPTSTSFPRKLNLQKKRRLFCRWRDLWVARSFCRFSLLRRSFDRWSGCSHRESEKWEEDPSNVFSETDFGDVSDLSSVSTSHTTISTKPDLRHFLHSSRAGRRRRGTGYPLPAMREITKTIQELSLVYRDRGLRDDDETMTSLSTLNTRDYIHLASHPSDRQIQNQQSAPIDEYSEDESLRFASPMIPSSLFNRSPDSSQNWKSSSGIGSLLIQHGDILPTHASPLRSSNAGTLSSSQPLGSVSLDFDRPLSRSLSGSPVGHRRGHHLSRGTRTPPPPPPPPLLSHNLKHFSPKPMESPSSNSSAASLRAPQVSRCRSLLRRWVFFHRRTVGVRLIATDHFLRRNFVLFSRSLRKRVRRRRDLLASQEFGKKTTVLRNLGRSTGAFISREHRALHNSPSSNVDQLSRPFKLFVHQIKFLKGKRSLLEDSSRLACRSFTDRSLSTAMDILKKHIQRCRFLRASRQKALSILRPYILDWLEYSELRRKLRNQFPRRHALQRRALRRWRSHFQLVLRRLQSFTEIDIRRETSLLVDSLTCLLCHSKWRMRLASLNEIANRHYRERRLAGAFYLLRSRKEFHRSHLFASHKFPLFRSLRAWVRWYQSRCEKTRTELVGHRCFATRRKRQFFLRFAGLLRHAADRTSAAEMKKVSRLKQISRRPHTFSVRTQGASRGINPSSSHLLIERADGWYHRRLLCSCREFLRKLWKLAFSRNSNKRSRPSVRHHQATSSPLLRSDRAHAEQQLYSKEIFLREKHHRVVLLDSFNIWFASFRGFRCHHLRLLRIGFLTFLQYCTRRTVAGHLLQLGDRFWNLRQKRWALRIWYDLLQRRKGRKDSPATPVSDEYLLDRSILPPYSRPPVHPPLSSYDLSRGLSSTRRSRWEGL